jgi:hypothetical protein
MDQVLAQSLAGQTRFGSLELTSDAPVLCHAGVGSGLGGSCTYMWTISWSGPTSPLPRENRPKRLFERLFGGDTVADAAAWEQRRVVGGSVLDVVRDDIGALQRRLGASDAQRLDAWLTHIEELEARLERVPDPPDPGCDAAVAAFLERWDLDAEVGIEAHVAQMSELMTLALQCDATRVITYMLGNVRSDRPYPHLGIPESHHGLSHHNYDADKIARIDTIGQWEVAQYAALLDRLTDVTEVDGTPLLDHTAAVFVSPFGDPMDHSPVNVPVVVAGRLGGALDPKGAVAATPNTPLARLHLTLLQGMGLGLDTFGEHGTSRLDLLDP